MKEYLERFRTWWSGLAQRERQLVGGGAAVLGVLFLYLAVWEPFVQVRKDRIEALDEARALAVRLEMMSADAKRNRGSGKIEGAGQSLLAVVDQSGKSSKLGKPPSRLQPDGDNTVRVWLDDVPFEAALRWLNELQTRYGVKIDNADIERQSGSGLVNVRVTLIR